MIQDFNVFIAVIWPILAVGLGLPIAFALALGMVDIAWPDNF
jgi:nitrate reductase NapE component